MKSSAAKVIFSWAKSLRGLRIGGHRFKLPIGVTPALQEPWMHEVLAKLLPDFKATFVDVGANLGQTLLYLRSLDSDRPYLGFDPNPHCVAAIERLIEINGMVNTIIVPAACSTSYGVVRLSFFTDSGFDSCASIIEGFRSESSIKRSSFVLTCEPSDVLATIGVPAIGIIKIDAEGAEADILEAFEDRIMQDRPAIIVEVLPAYTPDNHMRMQQNSRIEATVDRLGYVMFRIAKSSGSGFAGLVQISQFGVHSVVEDCDYLLISREAAGRYTD